MTDHALGSGRDPDANRGTFQLSSDARNDQLDLDGYRVGQPRRQAPHQDVRLCREARFARPCRTARPVLALTRHSPDHLRVGDARLSAVSGFSLRGSDPSRWRDDEAFGTYLDDHVRHAAENVHDLGEVLVEYGRGAGFEAAEPDVLSE